MNSSHQSHARKNLLTGEWVLVSPHRLQRPWQGQVDDREQDDELAHDPNCYLCPGNSRANDSVNPGYQGPFAFDNDFSALTTSSDIADTQGPLFESRPESGACRVVCYTEHHHQRLATMPVDDVRAALVTLNNEFEQLDQQDDVSYVQVFENRGQMMGCSNPHPHAQIWATENLPTEVANEFREQRDWYANKGTPLLADYCAAEIADGSRIVSSNGHFVTVVPYWATWPYETMLIPHRLFGASPDMTAEETSSLALSLSGILSAYDRLFDTATPYSMGFHPRPSDGQPHPEWLFHVHIYPPLLRSSTIRKHMVGFEMLAMPQRDITSEDAAEKLREHY